MVTFHSRRIFLLDLTQDWKKYRNAKRKILEKIREINNGLRKISSIYFVNSGDSILTEFRTINHDRPHINSSRLNILFQVSSIVALWHYYSKGALPFKLGPETTTRAVLNVESRWRPLRIEPRPSSNKFRCVTTAQRLRVNIMARIAGGNPGMNCGPTNRDALKINFLWKFAKQRRCYFYSWEIVWE